MDAKVVVITGASRGIGEEAAIAFARQKARLVLVARTPEDLERVRIRAMEAGSEEVLTVTTDISREEEVEVLVDVTLSRFGRIDILVNSAGVQIHKPLVETELADWDRMFDVNVKGMFLCSREVLRQMVQQGGGHIINISADVGHHGFAGYAGYCGAQFAVQGFTAAMRKEVEPHGVKVTCIMPAPTDTDDLVNKHSAAIGNTQMRLEAVARTIVYAASQPEGVLLHEINILA